MNYEEFLYLLPYLFSLALTLGIFIYSWQHRHRRGARTYSWFVFGQTLTILGFILELISPTLEIKIFWDKFQWLTDTYLVILPFLIFSLEFSEYKLRYPSFVRAGLVLFIGVFTILLLSDDIHHLFYPNPHLSTDSPFPELKYDFTVVVYLYSIIYLYGANVVGIGLLIRRALQPYNSYRMQYWAIIAGFLIPLVLSLFSLANIRITMQRDITPFSLAAGNLIVAWGLFRYKLFDIAPIARERIVENMIDPVIVLDPQNRVVDINHAALSILDKPGTEVIGLTAAKVFSKWPVIVELLENKHEQRREVSAQGSVDTSFLDISISPIVSKELEIIGRILVARDITRLKTLETSYRLLSQELEQRVTRRTKQLRESAERYRAVVENQTEFIVRWKPDRTRTFVNEAYCRYFGITYEQAIKVDFITQISEEDRPAVMEKIERLKSGESDVETEIHRVPMPDGSVSWQEWTDHAVRDATGQVIEFQSIGRDITERKQAEEALRESEAIYRRAIEVAGAVPYSQSYPEQEFHIAYDFIGDGIYQITGYTPEEFSEKLWDSLVQESHLLDELANYSWREAIQRVRSGASPIWKCEHRIRARNGETRWVYEAAVELRDKNGKSHGSIGLYQDITQRKLAENALRTSEERFSKAFKASPIIITISQIKEGRLLEVNETFEKITGYKREEVVGRSTTELGLWANPADRHHIVVILLETGEFRNEEIQFRIKNGSIVTCLVSGDLIELDGERCVLATIEDISERKKAEARILHLNRLYVTISQINQTIVHAHDRQTLFQEICRVATDHGKFRMAWIGVTRETDGVVEPLVFAGEEQGYLANLKIDFRDELHGRGPTGTAIREGHCTICQDIASDDRMTQWREQALSRGYGSSAAVPLRENGHVIGALTVYATEPNSFNAEDESLLEQIGQDVSFALDSINTEKERSRAEENLAVAYDTTLEGWARALELRDKETEGHSRRVTETTLIVAREMGFDEEALVHIRRGSILHDIGKMGIPDDILRKNGPLTEVERSIVTGHPQTAYSLLRSIPYLEKALEIPYSHHEKWDGSGYPRQLKAEEIPLPARIFAVVDVWDALSSDRPYRKAWPREQIIEYLLSESGKHFDPKVVDLFLQMLQEGKI